ncbi:hypothetical protein FOA52_014079 [Chlamydomonas sp. UWO 241]|nr:hypothetical protein FOA52_014079 [Chlamydomonas sp. UWO 241]
MDEQRAGDYTRAVMWHQGNRATEFFSRWIELKESRIAAEAESKAAAQARKYTLYVEQAME